jgi:hypothetical protein
MAAMNRSQFAKELQKGLNTVFGLDYRQYPEEWRKIFESSSSDKAFEEDVLVTGFGAAPVKAEGASTAYDEGAEAWTSRYTHETVALQFAITEEAIEDNLYMQTGAKYAKALARSMQHTKEIKAASVLNNGFNSSFVGGDGKSLFATDHPLAGGGSTSNMLTTPADFSETALEDILIQIRTAKDDRGIPIALVPKLVCVPPQLEYVAIRVLASTLRSGTPDNDINAIKSKNIFSTMPHVITRLTDPDFWFVKTDAMDGLKYFDRVALKKRVEIDHDTGNYKYLTRERYSLGWSDFRTVFGSQGSA